MAKRGDVEYLTEAQAERLWRRAAELQAEAESVVPKSEGELPPGEAIRLRDVEAAAIEVGITPEFLHLARAEARAWEGQRLGPRADRAATILLGSETRILRVRRWFRAPPARILEIIGRIYPAAPFQLSVKDMSGDDPARGAVLVFDTPGWAQQTPFSLAMLYADLKQVLVSVTPGQSAEQAGCDVTVVGSLELARKKNLRVSGWLSLMLGSTGGIAGVALAAVAELPALGVALSAIIGTTLAAAGFAGLHRLGYRSGLRKGQAGLEDLLRAIDVQLRTGGVIAQPAAAAQPPAPDIVVFSTI